jgi:AcrR family transcriptional regulator
MARPRSEEAHRKVLDAALRLFSERGIDATSMDAIATASGVSKATIYKHWPDKDALALEVLSWLHGLDEEPPAFDSGDLRADLIAALSHQPTQDRMETKERMMPHLIAYSAINQVFGKAWRERVVGRQQMQLGRILKTAVAHGELDSHLDLETAVALLVGPLVYRHIFVVHKSRDRESMHFIEQIVDAFRRSFQTGAHAERSTKAPPAAKKRSGKTNRPPASHVK